MPHARWVSGLCDLGPIDKTLCLHVGTTVRLEFHRIEIHVPLSVQREVLRDRGSKAVCLAERLVGVPALECVTSTGGIRGFCNRRAVGNRLLVHCAAIVLFERHGKRRVVVLVGDDKLRLRCLVLGGTIRHRRLERWAILLGIRARDDDTRPVRARVVPHFCKRRQGAHFVYGVVVGPGLHESYGLEGCGPASHGRRRTHARKDVPNGGVLLGEAEGEGLVTVVSRPRNLLLHLEHGCLLKLGIGEARRRAMDPDGAHLARRRRREADRGLLAHGVAHALRQVRNHLELSVHEPEPCDTVLEQEVAEFRRDSPV